MKYKTPYNELSDKDFAKLLLMHMHLLILSLNLEATEKQELILPLLNDSQNIISNPIVAKAMINNYFLQKNKDHLSDVKKTVEEALGFILNYEEEKLMPTSLKNIIELNKQAERICKKPPILQKIFCSEPYYSKNIITCDLIPKIPTSVLLDDIVRTIKNNGDRPNYSNKFNSRKIKDLKKLPIIEFIKVLIENCGISYVDAGLLLYKDRSEDNKKKSDKVRKTLVVRVTEIFSFSYRCELRNYILK